MTGSVKKCQISPISEMTFGYILEEKYVLNRIYTLTLQTYRSSFRCEDTAADKQPVNGAKLLNFRCWNNFPCYYVDPLTYYVI